MKKNYGTQLTVVLYKSRRKENKEKWGQHPPKPIRENTRQHKTKKNRISDPPTTCTTRIPHSHALTAPNLHRVDSDCPWEKCFHKAHVRNFTGPPPKCPPSMPPTTRNHSRQGTMHGVISHTPINLINFLANLDTFAKIEPPPFSCFASPCPFLRGPEHQQQEGSMSAGRKTAKTWEQNCHN